MVFDPGAFDTGMEVVANLVLGCVGKFAPKKGGDVIRFDGMDGGSNQFFVNGLKVFSLFEHYVGSIFDLH